MSSIIKRTNIQGDIWPGLPKKFQTFLFFRIRKPDQFKLRLKAFVPEITTAATAARWRDEKKQIKLAEKEHPKDQMAGSSILANTGVNLAFASTGLAALGKFTFREDLVRKDRKLGAIFKKQQLRGGLFGKGMYGDLVGEGWDDPRDLRAAYKPIGDKNERQIDGVFLVTSNIEDEMKRKVNDVRNFFLNGSEPDTSDVPVPVIEFPLVRVGRTLPGKKEHFGFKDGISQPQIEGLDQVPEELAPKAVKPGMILSGYDGDDMAQPKWATDGSFLVIRDLQQLVPEFDNFMEENAHYAPKAPADSVEPKVEPKEKLAAYLMGRWKNGTPVDMSPHSDNPDLKLQESNNFDYNPIDKHDKCPFGAHIRKMRPRGDLGNDHAVIIRRGISYGVPVTEPEKLAKKSDDKLERGLIFACYQSDIRNGFQFLTTRWASNHHFPDRKTKFVGEHGPGIDAIVGQRLSHHPERSLGLPDGNVPSESRITLDSWVIHRGGEYFFSPSIKAIDEYLTGPHDYPSIEGQ